ncbi:MAG: FKBP-type peptidyl-prolyl cis-trans isomerase [Parasphingorhabdus sp.]|nr:FKBP-type peptidyl-prolyl cis-trans isomerase [Parasphingorhabdus sp.]
MSVTAVPIRPVKKGSLTLLWIGLALAALIAFGLAWAGTRTGIITTESGLQYKVLKDGKGESPVATDTALIKYVGKLEDGTVFDENPQAPVPVDGMIPGFSEALKLMKKGGEYRLWIPGKLAYGAQSPSPKIPPNATLVFDVTLLDFISQQQMSELQAQMLQQQQQQMQSGGGAGPPEGAMPQR